MIFVECCNADVRHNAADAGNLMMLQIDELLADITEYSTRFHNCWDFDRKYEKTIGKMLASLE